jgi:hypothetical protein
MPSSAAWQFHTFRSLIAPNPPGHSSGRASHCPPSPVECGVVERSRHKNPNDSSAAKATSSKKAIRRLGNLLEAWRAEMCFRKPPPRCEPLAHGKGGSPPR